ncbi:hypothetical protein PFISCL1PPCAC_1866, partial [Pristionchus fissidentatus]
RGAALLLFLLSSIYFSTLPTSSQVVVPTGYGGIKAYTMNLGGPGYGMGYGMGGYGMGYGMGYGGGFGGYGGYLGYGMPGMYGGYGLYGKK